LAEIKRFLFLLIEVSAVEIDEDLMLELQKPLERAAFIAKSTN